MFNKTLMFALLKNLRSQFFIYENMKISVVQVLAAAVARGGVDNYNPQHYI